jgi:tRNA A-37 threonylcarbamoyl transferase component Bud32
LRVRAVVLAAALVLLAPPDPALAEGRGRERPLVRIRLPRELDPVVDAMRRAGRTLGEAVPTRREPEPAPRPRPPEPWASEPAPDPTRAERAPSPATAPTPTPEAEAAEGALEADADAREAGLAEAEVPLAGALAADVPVPAVSDTAAPAPRGRGVDAALLALAALAFSLLGALLAHRSWLARAPAPDAAPTRVSPAHAPHPPHDAPTLPSRRRYALLEEIGRGGMGVVYRARDTRLDRIVAVKRLSESFREHPRAVELLLREARSAAQLGHPHIVVVYDVDQDPEDGSYFVTMEYLEGAPLSSLLARRGRFEPRAVVWLGQQAAAGLAYAHERRIVHRDVKPANLFLTRSRVLKIMDFGLARVVEEVRKRATLIGGTPAYMAPEQAVGLEVDGRADLYALGVTFFELLTGALPFEEGDPAHHHRHTRPPDPRERRAAMPDALAALVLELLAKDPDERPASASEVAARLRAIAQALAAAAA